MKLTVLGSGSCELKAERSSSAYVVEIGDALIMLDLGQGAWRRLLESGYKVSDVEAVLLSHHHLDHLADLLPLLFALNYDPVLSLAAEIELVADEKVAEVLEGLKAVFGQWVDAPEHVFETRWVQPNQEFQIAGATFRTMRTAHIESSLAFRLENNGHSLVYLGDSAFTDALVDFCRDADLVIAHAAAPDDKPSDMHMSARQAGQLADAAEVRSLLLSHFYRHTEPADAVRSAGIAFEGWIAAAEDLMTVDIGDLVRH